MQYIVARRTTGSPGLWDILPPFSPLYDDLDIRFGFADGDSLIYGYSRYIDHHPGGSQSGGVFRSADNGLTWRQFTTISSVTALERYNDTIIIGTPEGSLATASLNSGKSNVIGALGGEITAIDAKRFGGGELIVATRGGIFKTTDGGLNWRKSDTGIMHPKISSVQVIPSGNGSERIVVSTQKSGVFFSDDTGEHWKWSNPDVRTIPGLLKASESTPRRIYAAEASIHVSRDNGETWERIEHIPAVYYGWYGRTVDIDIDPRNADRIAVTYYDHSLDDLRGVRYHEGRYTEKPENEGSQWEWGNEFESGEQFKCQFSNDGSLIWVSSKSWQLYSKPFLDSFVKSGEITRNINLPGYSGQYFWLIDGQYCYVFGDQEKRIWVSPDLGETWNSTDLILNDYVRYDDYNSADRIGDMTISPDGKTVFLLYPGNGILASGDRGKTWRQCNKGLDTAVVYQLAFYPANPSIIFAATDDGLYRLDESSGIEHIGESRSEPVPFTLAQNVPNPFNPSTVIGFELRSAMPVRLTIYSLTGQKVRELVSGAMRAGGHSVAWTAVMTPGRRYPPVYTSIGWKRAEGV